MCLFNELLQILRRFMEVNDVVMCNCACLIDLIKELSIFSKAKRPN